MKLIRPHRTAMPVAQDRPGGGRTGAARCSDRSAAVATPARRPLLAFLLAAALGISLGLVAPATPAHDAAAAAGASVSASSTAAVPTHRWVGFYMPGAPWSTAKIREIESRIGMKPTVYNYFQNTEQGFTSTPAGNAVARGATPLVTLELWEPAKGVKQPAYSLKKITDGSHDAYLRQYARDAKAFGKTVWLRPLHEMNGTWYPWGGTVNGNAPQDFVPAWRHLKDIFAEEGATNVKFVWCPNIESIPMTSENAISVYWPGDEYVDYIALDGYNFGSARDLKWRSFTDLFRAPYATVTRLSDKPVFVAETSCVREGGDKAAWIAEMFASVPTRFPRICGVGWFNRYDEDEDLRVNSTSACLNAYIYGATRSGWTGRRPTSLTIASSATKPVHGKSFTLSGRLTPGKLSDRVCVGIKKSGSSRWTYARPRLAHTSHGDWRSPYVIKTRGTYSIRVKYAGDSTRKSCISRVITVTVR